MTTWEKIDVPRGGYVSWGTKPGQHVTGVVLAYDDEGGTDFGGNVCPSLSIELTEAGESFNKEGVRSEFGVGETIQLNAGQVSLKRAVRAARLKVGDEVKITFFNLAKTSNGTCKEFDIEVARAKASATAQPAGDAPPF